MRTAIGLGSARGDANGGRTLIAAPYSCELLFETLKSRARVGNVDALNRLSLWILSLFISALGASSTGCDGSGSTETSLTDASTSDAGPATATPDAATATPHAAT